MQAGCSGKIHARAAYFCRPMREATLTADSAILRLEDGTTFRGRPWGRRGTTTGEVCFNTGMAGCQEVFTDPSYRGARLSGGTVG